MSKKGKKRDYLPFMDLEENNGFMGIPLVYEDYEMILKSLFNKVVLAKKYDVNFTYSIDEDFSKNKGKKFDEVSERFEASVVELLSEMMDFCNDIHMEVLKK